MIYTLHVIARSIRLRIFLMVRSAMLLFIDFQDPTRYRTKASYCLVLPVKYQLFKIQETE